MMNHKKIPREFFNRNTHVVAQEMLGKLLIRSLDGEDIIGRITEVESYIGENDLACHASKGRTPRCEVMFGEAGHAYVYLIYGIYNCLNIVTERNNLPAAVLIRSLEPIQGIAQMKVLRKTEELKNLTTGPGKLTQAFNITRLFNTEDVTTSNQLYLADDNYKLHNQNVTKTARIGVEYAGKDALLPWRYYIKNSEFISRK